MKNFIYKILFKKNKIIINIIINKNDIIFNTIENKILFYKYKRIILIKIMRKL